MTIKPWVIMITIFNYGVSYAEPGHPENRETINVQRICGNDSIPLGAQEGGYTIKLIDVCPTAEDIEITPTNKKPLHRGLWFSKKIPDISLYSTTKNSLRIALGGSIATARRDSTPGILPLLKGEKGFYVEFQVSTSDNNKDNWPAVWLLPIEHNSQQKDHFDGDPDKFERWMELDVDEGGFGLGFMGTVISWSGIWPNYQRIMNDYNKMSKTPLDRTIPHIFAASYDPIKKTVSWWVDNIFQMTARAPEVPNIAIHHNYYLIVSAQTHSNNNSYYMDLYGIRAFVRP